VEDESGRLNTTFHNNASDRSIGLELMGDFNPNSWWNLNASGSVFQHHISGQVVSENIEKDNISWSTQLVNSFQIDQKTNAQLICFYRSTTQNLQYNITDFFFTDISVKRKFFHDKLDVGLTVKDVFGTMNYKLITEAQNTYLEGLFNNESPIVLLNVSYQISQYQKKTKDVHTEFDM
jgi:hypothetical protein